MADGLFSRTGIVLGEAGLHRLARAHVAIFGVGGVGSWCAEALVRTGLGSITLVDGDTVVASNVNRQAMAMPGTVGQVKVAAMRERLLAINPALKVEAIHARFNEESARSFDFAVFDAVVDAIDAVDDKALLIRTAAARENLAFVSSMGAALRTDPTQVRLDAFSRVAGDGLAKALRRRFRLDPPARDFASVHSLEAPQVSERLGRGSLMPVTCAFGMALAAATVKFLLAKTPEK